METFFSLLYNCILFSSFSLLTITHVGSKNALHLPHHLLLCFIKSFPLLIYFLTYNLRRCLPYLFLSLILFKGPFVTAMEIWEKRIVQIELWLTCCSSSSRPTQVKKYYYSVVCVKSMQLHSALRVVHHSLAHGNGRVTFAFYKAGMLQKIMSP